MQAPRFLRVKWFRKTFNNKKKSIPCHLQVLSPNTHHFNCFSFAYSVLTVHHHAMLVAYASFTPGTDFRHYLLNAYNKQ